MAFDTRDEDRGGFTDINITPLLDVLIVLLAISLVTGAALAPGLLHVSLPARGGVAAAAGSGPVTVSVDAAGELAVDGALSTTEKLEDDIRGALAARGSVEVVVAGDRSAALERAVFALEASRRAGAERASIATQGATR